jgi:hypothetical protein
MSTRVWTLFAAALAVGLSGCGSNQDVRQFSAEDNVTNTAPPAEHHHPEHGPNGGHIVVLGAHAYHAELVFDATTRNVTVHLLDHDMTAATPVADAGLTLNLEGSEPITFEASPIEGEPEGQTSRFTLSGDKLPEGVKGEEDLHGSLALTVGGEPHAGAISHAHDHEGGHDHKHE